MGLMRGCIYAATLNPAVGEKYYVVVSNNRRNATLGSVLAVRLTSRPKPAIPSIVTLSPADGTLGRHGGSVVCDDIIEIYDDEVRAQVGVFTPATMARIDGGLRAALALT